MGIDFTLETLDPKLKGTEPPERSYLTDTISGLQACPNPLPIPLPPILICCTDR